MPKSVSLFTFHFSLFTFHFSLFINTSIHYFKGSLSARFRSPSDLCQRFGLQFLPMHPRQGNHHLWHGVDLLVPGQHRIRNGGAGGGWLRATCLILVPCESWKNNKWELLCAKRFHYLHNDSGSTFITGSILMPGSIFINRQDLQGNTLPLQTSQISILPFYR